MEQHSYLLRILHLGLRGVVFLTMDLPFRLFGVRKEHIALRHTEIFLVSTTLLFIFLVAAYQYFPGIGWGIVILGNLRILQVISINLMTILFDFTPIRSGAAAERRVRWHFIALAFSFFDVVLIFGFKYQFYDSLFQIMNQQGMEFLDYLYYSLMTMTTIGYGDIHPVNSIGQLVSMYQAVVALFFLIFAVTGALSRLHQQAMKSD